jgi:hypothetical protein
MVADVLPYEVDERLGVIIVRIERQPSLEDWMATLDALPRDPRWFDGIGVVTDRRHVPAPNGEYVRNAIRAIADRFAARGPMRWATVAPPGVVAFGMGRMAELMGESSDVTFRMFRSLDEAVSWATRRR